MTSIQNALDCSAAKFAANEQLLPLALAKAAKRQNLSLSELEIQRLTNAILGFFSLPATWGEKWGQPDEQRFLIGGFYGHRFR